MTTSNIFDKPNVDRDRRDACKWAHDLMQRQDWCVIDTETSGLRGVILELAIIAPDGGELFNSLINPDGERIEEGARNVHKIQDSDLARAPKLDFVWEQIGAALSGCKTIVTYNAAFDQARIEQSAKRYKLQKLGQQWQCAMIHYSQYVGEWSSYRDEYKWQKLPSAGHRAIEDARAALEVIQKMAKEWEHEYAAEESATKPKDDQRARQLVKWLKEQPGE